MSRGGVASPQAYLWRPGLDQCHKPFDARYELGCSAKGSPATENTPGRQCQRILREGSALRCGRQIGYVQAEEAWPLPRPTGGGRVLTSVTSASTLDTN
jgi:hypothetical protein